MKGPPKPWPAVQQSPDSSSDEELLGEKVQRLYYSNVLSTVATPSPAAEVWAAPGPSYAPGPSFASGTSGTSSAIVSWAAVAATLPASSNAPVHAPVQRFDDPNLQEQDIPLSEEDRERESLFNDVVISGVPEHAREKLVKIVMTVADEMGMLLHHEDIISAFRVGQRHRWFNPRQMVAVGLPLGPVARANPRPIVVKLKYRSLRNEFLTVSRECRGTSSLYLGLPPHEPFPVYVNERLAKNTRHIMGIAVKVNSTLNPRWKIWSRDGRIYAKKTMTSKPYWLRTFEQAMFFYKHEETDTNK